MSISASLSRLTRAFRNRNYSIYASGNICNLIGLWMQRIAVGWLTWQMTESGTWLGVMSAADLLPTLFIAPFAGAVADRGDRLWLAKLTQLLALLQASTLALLTLSGWLTIGLLLTLTIVQGIIFSFWQPVRLALFPSLVRKEDLASAVAVNSVIFNSARFIGPALAGVVLVVSDAGWTFAVYALSLAIFFVALFFIRLDGDDHKARAQGRFFSDIVAGYAYVMRHPGIGPCLLLLIASSVLMRPVFELLPGFAAEVFERGAEGLSALASVTGIGAVMGGVWLGQRAGIDGLTRLMITNVLLQAICLLVFAATDVFWLGLICLWLAGMTVTLSGASGQTLIQATVEPTMRGRVMALYGMTIRAGPAIGALIMGMLSDSVGLQLPLIGGCLLALLVWWRIFRRSERLRVALESG
jgi:predicted MFS family arabinose efflux permease